MAGILYNPDFLELLDKELESEISYTVSEGFEGIPLLYSPDYPSIDYQVLIERNLYDLSFSKYAMNIYIKDSRRIGTSIGIKFDERKNDDEISEIVKKYEDNFSENRIIRFFQKMRYTQEMDPMIVALEFHPCLGYKDWQRNLLTEINLPKRSATFIGIKRLDSELVPLHKGLIMVPEHETKTSSHLVGDAGYPYRVFLRPEEELDMYPVVELYSAEDKLYRELYF